MLQLFVNLHENKSGWMAVNFPKFSININAQIPSEVPIKRFNSLVPFLLCVLVRKVDC